MTIESAIKSFANGMKEASEIISDENPDFVIAPMMGSVSFIDAMNASDINFNPNLVFYMPASSHVPFINNVMKDWMSNFLSTYASADEKIKILTIDEVVSGGSATRVNSAVQNAVSKRIKEIKGDIYAGFWNQNPVKFQEAAMYLDNRTDHKHGAFFSMIVLNQENGVYQKDRSQFERDVKKLRRIVESTFSDQIQFIGVGVEDSKNGIYETRERNKTYLQLVKQGIIKPVQVETILTMDKPELCPVQYQLDDSKSRIDHVRFTPIVDVNSVITPKYENLLQKICQYCSGRSNALPISVERAIFSGDYLSPEFGGTFKTD